MKVYNTIQEAKEADEIITFPGIYYFRNKINNKYYIGQAINIRKRFSSHFIQIKKENNKYPIYKAILNYGIENFEYGIIGVFKSYESKELLKKKLDFLEKKYIKEYNSYGSSGYNQTLGGDGGILGYKMTQEQIESIKINSKKVANDGRNTIYVYDLFEEKEYMFSSYTEASEILNVKRDTLYSAERRNGICTNRYIPRKTKEEIYYFLRNLNVNKINKGQFQKKLSKEEFNKIIKLYPNKTINELCDIMGICKKTFYNYKNEI